MNKTLNETNNIEQLKLMEEHYLNDFIKYQRIEVNCEEQLNGVREELHEFLIER